MVSEDDAKTINLVLDLIIEGAQGEFSRSQALVNLVRLYIKHISPDTEDPQPVAWLSCNPSWIPRGSHVEKAR